MFSTLSAEDILDDLSGQWPQRAYIDVRSELEFSRGRIPLFQNAPILFQAERHLVGTTYKQEGQEAAIRLGYELVTPVRDQRVRAWAQKIEASPSREGVILCWRGGLRSKIACEWLDTAGSRIFQVADGYKALRQHLTRVFERPLPLLVIAGLTGSGKTDLLLEFPDFAVDLEGAAHHRGSLFGRYWDEGPSAQATFENSIALGFQRPVATFLIEDESRFIGPLHIPDVLFQQFQRAPLIILDDDRASRAERIWRNYVALPLENGVPVEVLSAGFAASLKSLQRPLD
ncbi:MAG: tRNA 2-selenouridine(34) synthase MnmH, partial [Acidobacteriota bacterium]